MKKGNFQEVYQVGEKIVKYFEQYLKGLFEESLFVFDARLGVKYDQDVNKKNSLCILKNVLA